MATLNKAMLIGRLTNDPETSTLPNGTKIAKFRFAVGRGKKNAAGQWENDPRPLYIDCEAFTGVNNKRDLVNIISQYAKKGDSLYVEGKIAFDQWDDKVSGVSRSKHKLVVENVEFMGGTGSTSGENGGQTTHSRPGAGGGEHDDQAGGFGGGDDSPIPF